MFETTVLAFRVLADDAQVDVVVSGLVAWDILDKHDGGVDVEFLAQRDIEGLVTAAFDWCVEDSLQTELVSFQRGNRLLKEFFTVFVAVFDTRDVDLLPLDGDVVSFEDGLDGFGDFGTNTVTCIGRLVD